MGGVLVVATLTVGCTGTAEVGTTATTGTAPSTAACPTAPAEFDANNPPGLTAGMDPDLAQAIGNRYRFGLNADPAFVADLLQRPDLDRSFVVPVTPEELPIVRHQLLMQDYHHLVVVGETPRGAPVTRPPEDPNYPGYPALASRLGALIGDTFAGSWTTHTGLGAIVIASTKPVDEVAVKALFPADAVLDFEVVRFSERELIDRARSLTSSITADRHLGPAYLGRNGRVTPSIILNGLVVDMADPADEQRDCAFRRFVGDIPVAIHHGMSEPIPSAMS